MEQVQEQQFRYVGFWMRAVATIIDLVIVNVVIALVFLAFYGTSDFSKMFSVPAEPTDLFAGPADLVLQIVVQVLLVVVLILFWRYRGGTPGKMLISARIVDADTGQAPSTGKLIGRFFAYIVSTVPFCLGFLWVAFDRRKQGWHDRLAGTVVVYDKSKGWKPRG